MPDPHPLRLGALLSGRLDRAGDVVTLVLAGEFDLAGVASFSALLDGVEATRPRALVIDLRGLDFLDSSGLRAVYDAHVRAEGVHSLGVLAGTGAASRALVLSGFDQALTIVACGDEASAA